MKILRQFLTENKALDTFCTNVLLRNTHCMNIQKVEKLIDTLCEHRGIIASYFVWDNTPQSADYWCNLSTEWDKYLINDGCRNYVTAESINLIL